jgi:Leucine-rich repeat (LRR) protein
LEILAIQGSHITSISFPRKSNIKTLNISTSPGLRLDSSIYYLERLQYLRVQQAVKDQIDTTRFKNLKEIKTVSDELIWSIDF